MKVIYQLWGLTPVRPDWEELLRKIALLQERRPAEALVCGAGAPEEIYRRILDIARRFGSRTYLWLPVFSEWDDLAAYDPLRDRQGQDYLAPLGLTGFHFRCPESGFNRDAFYQESLRCLAQAPFDGVFLDRIRYPSFQFGLPGILSCFCPACRERYREMSLDPDGLADACEALERRVRQVEDDPLGLRVFDGSRWQIGDPSLQALLDARCRIITKALEDLCGRYREKGYRIGLDLFAPALGYFAGQDVRSLAPLADFVKPMLYLDTLAPAGLPYEIDVMAGSLGGGTRERFLALLGADSPEEYAAQEIGSMHSLIPGTPVFCGMEYNRVADIASVGPDQIRRTLRVFRTAGAQGAMPSWSLFSAPDENLSALTDGLAD